jgi:hypothetical protein
MTYNGGDFYFSRDKRPSGSESTQRPNPLTLILKTEDPQPEWIPNGTVSPNDMDQIACLVTFDPIKSPDLLKQARTIRNSIEISSDDNYFVNTLVSARSASGSEIDQRAIASSELGAELNKMIGSSDDGELELIVSENASYASLLKLLAMIEKSGVVIKANVRPMVLSAVKK